MFEITVYVVGVAGIALCMTPWGSPGRAVRSLGRSGASWFDHAEDRLPGERPSEDDRDAPLPARPLRGRPDWF